MAIPESRRLDFTEIPVIDLARLVAGKPDQDADHSLGRACRDIGFAYVENHGVAAQLIESLLDESMRFFARPEQDKSPLVVDERLRGLLPMHYRSYEGEPIAATQHHEGYWIGRDRPLNPDNPLDGPNRWPPDDDAFRTAADAYMLAVRRLSIALQRAFSRSLGLHESFFDDLFRRSTSSLLINHYPPQDTPQAVTDIGITPHTDDGGFTILWQDDNGGLEIESKNGEWVGAPPIPGTFVINLGKVMQIWTGGEFSATPHRVINRSGTHRYSFPFFVNPRWDVPLRPMLGNAEADPEAPLYGVYQRDNWRRTFPIARIPE